MDSTTPQTDSTTAPEKRPMFDTVVVSTPVILTVIATFILGRSSSEMTQAQYQRAVASQKQSKVADEWAFFQAKRIRGTTYEATSIALFAQKAGPFTPASLLDTAQDFLREIALTEKDAPKLAVALKSLDSRTEAELAQIKAALNPPETDPKAEGKKPVLTAASVKDAFAALEFYPKLKSEKMEDDADEQSKILKEILDDVRAFKPENEIGEKTLKLGLKTETIDAAIEKAKAYAKKVNERGKYIDRVLEEFDAIVDRQVGLTREYQRIVGAYLRDLDNKDDVQKIERRLDRVSDLSAKLLMDYKAARFAFDARRYEDDARSNQQAAFLYDVHVYQSSAKSDKHLKRSFGFMIAMLVAQVGVTVGSIALGFRRRIPAWALAAIAGISAIIFGVLVFLEMAPMLMQEGIFPMNDDAVIDATRRWIASMVIGLNLCPFAQRVFDGDKIRYVVSSATTEKDLRNDLIKESQFLVATPIETTETTLLIHPQVFGDFLDYNDFLDVAEGLLFDLGLEGVLQIASFHPQYQFADTEPDAAENYTNRSPFPMLHLLREESISAIADDAERLLEIPNRNIETMRALGRARILERLGGAADKSN